MHNKKTLIDTQNSFSNAINRLYGYALTITNDSEVSKDLVQDALEVALKKGIYIDKDFNFYYITGIVKKCFYKLKRDEKSTYDISEIDAEDFTEEIERKEMIEELINTINQYKDGDLFIDFYIKEKSLKVLAIEYKLKEKTISKKIRRLAHKLAEQLHIY